MKFVYQFFSFLKMLRVYFNINVFRRRFFSIVKTGNKVEIKKQPEKILAVIAHVVPGADNAAPEKLERLLRTLDGLLISLDAFHLTIVLLTKEFYSLHEKLPAYLKDKVEIYYSSQQDPMYVEYDAFDVFSKRKDEFDYFMFLEDDIILNDSCFVEKIKKFNSISPEKNYVLLPHRYEYYNGFKSYFDQCSMSKNGPRSNSYSEHLKLVSDDAVFTIFENSHSAFYCLNKEQMMIWIKSGYQWKNKIAAVGLLESAATFCMYENFEFFKPHPCNMFYLEVQHWGNKHIVNVF